MNYHNIYNFSLKQKMQISLQRQNKSSRIILVTFLKYLVYIFRIKKIFLVFISVDFVLELTLIP